jgi:hypothetical protein
MWLGEFLHHEAHRIRDGIERSSLHVSRDPKRIRRLVKSYPSRFLPRPSHRHRPVWSSMTVCPSLRCVVQRHARAIGSGGMSSRARRPVGPPPHRGDLQWRSLPRIDPAGYSGSSHPVARGAADDGRAIRTGEDPGLYACFRWEHARHDPHKPHRDVAFRAVRFAHKDSSVRPGLWRQDYPHPILQSWCASQYNGTRTVARRSGG